jgi:hypothetical protein
MEALVPLFQTIAWVALALYLAHYFRPEIVILRNVLSQRLESGGMVRIGPLELGALQKKVANVTKELGDLNARVSVLFLSTMSLPMYVNLKKLASGHFGSFQKTKGLQRELYHLRDIGYIDVRSITDIPAEAANLSDYVSITETGQRFVSLRMELERSQRAV